MTLDQDKRRPKELTTIIGKLIGVNPGEILELQDGWIYKDLSDSQLLKLCMKIRDNMIQWSY